MTEMRNYKKRGKQNEDERSREYAKENELDVIKNNIIQI